MGKTLYLDCSSGISGDMTVAALLDLGASEQRLREALSTLPAHGFDVAVTRVRKSGLDACDFDVRLDAAHENHDHDMAWLYGHLDASEHEHAHEHDHEHDHAHENDHAHEHSAGHDHAHAHHHHHHEHRSLADVCAIIDASAMSERAKKLAHAVFGKLAEAEAKAHGATPETVMFHEVGAIDSIVDICSVALCLDDLDVTEVIVPSLAEGHGTIRCAHGIMPVPVPAVVNLCQAAGIALVPAPVTGELVTPTGAAIVAALRTGNALPASYAIERVGYGAGKRAYENCSGVLRAVLIASEVSDDADDGDRSTITKLESDLDDCTGEALGRVIELLMAAGAREAHAIPIVMKKGRPGHQLEVICDGELAPTLERIIFENTTTIGIRSMDMRRHALPRTPDGIETPYGYVATKLVVMPDGHVRSYPEYSSVVEACERTGASFQDVFRATQAAADAGHSGDAREA
ncbi:MAG: LarC family nickel insertion protein [Parolsenella sp.]|uniref:LarC family nickel insertion protein n=1 Tax=Parolsenella sp. TaxID=2083006 RepID=UPI002E78D11C|nr:LarC family nickel insertion protein [Parolsenella sp.]MEE1373502.1 LarC family nickel insertion protein [Parolsenella sp.]